MSRPKLLLADDSVTIRKVVELTFADEGIDVSTAADSKSAMERFVEIQPDIVLVDVGLDGTSGYQICEMIKLDEATRHIPVLLLVGSFEPFDQDEAERVGADGFLTKPFHSIRDLIARVADLLGRESALPPAAEMVEAEDALEHLPNGDIDEPVTPETADIANLYRSSFAQTVEIDEFDTVDDMLGDPALDDEMIEATFPAESYTENLSGLIPPVETIGQTKGFDWSPESIVAETPAAKAAAAGFEPKFMFEEHDDAAPEPEIADTPDPTPEMALETITEEIAEPGPDAETPASPIAGEPSPEFIALIAQKVVERLSDKVIREIAQEAVPRIAEKLIREALDDGGKKQDQSEI